VEHWSLTTLRDKLIKIGAKIVYHAGYVVFQMAEGQAPCPSACSSVAEVAVPRELFAKILERIGRLPLGPG
jgi:hypothetical protein